MVASVEIKYDLIIVACSSKKELINITQNCIDSARQDGVKINVIIVETHPIIHQYKDCVIIPYKGPFNYNRALNKGILQAKSDLFILANNDIIFQPGWSRIGEMMKLNGYESASAISSGIGHRAIKRGDWVYEGYVIGIQLTGWCIFVTRNCIDRIGGLDESFDFWYSDNIYADQLITAGIKHGLFCNVQVDHITSATLRTVPPRTQRRLSHDNTTRYKNIQKQIRNAG